MRIVLSKERYEDLIEKEERLEVLENCGVDNWEGYEYAMELIYGNKEEEE